MRDLNDVWSKPIKLEPQSPCNNNCTISSQTGFCIGCFLSLKEVIDWETATAGERELILDKIEERKQKKNEI